MGKLTDMKCDELMAKLDGMKAHVVSPEMTPFTEFVREEEGKLLCPWDIAEREESW